MRGFINDPEGASPRMRGHSHDASPCRALSRGKRAADILALSNHVRTLGMRFNSGVGDAGASRCEAVLGHRPRDSSALPLQRASPLPHHCPAPIRLRACRQTSRQSGQASSSRS